MKIIDEKGRLFGKVNIIDFFVIIFLLSLIPIFYFGYQISVKDKIALQEQRALEANKALGGEQQPKRFVEAEILCNLIEVPSGILESMGVGDKEVDGNGEVIGELTWMGESRKFEYTYNLGEYEGGKVARIRLESPTLNQMDARLKLKVEVRGADLYYNDQSVKISSPFIFKTDRYTLKAVPRKLQKEYWVGVKLYARFSYTDTELIKVIKEGQVQKDKDGRVIGRLNKIIGVIPAQSAAFPYHNNKFELFDDPSSSDLVVFLQLLCSEENGMLYYNDMPLRIGHPLYFSPNLSCFLMGKVVEIEIDNVSDYNRK